MEAEDVVVLIWNDDKEPQSELAGRIGADIADALGQGAAYRVRKLSLTDDAFASDAALRASVVFPVAVGASNTGRLQLLLEKAGLAFTGSGSTACQQAHDARLWRPMLSEAGILVSPFLVCERGCDLRAVAARAVSAFAEGCLVKPSLRDEMAPQHGGNSQAEVKAGLEAVLDASGSAVLEAIPKGARRFSLACLRDGPGVVSLPVVEIVDSANVTRPTTLYMPWDTVCVCPAIVDPQLRDALHDVAVAAHHRLGCIVSRTEVLVNSTGSLAVSDSRRRRCSSHRACWLRRPQQPGFVSAS